MALIMYSWPETLACSLPLLIGATIVLVFGTRAYRQLSFGVAVATCLRVVGDFFAIFAAHSQLRDLQRTSPSAWALQPTSGVFWATVIGSILYGVTAFVWPLLVLNISAVCFVGDFVLKMSVFLTLTLSGTLQTHRLPPMVYAFAYTTLLMTSFLVGMVLTAMHPLRAKPSSSDPESPAIAARSSLNKRVLAWQTLAVLCAAGGIWLADAVAVLISSMPWHALLLQPFSPSPHTPSTLASLSQWLSLLFGIVAGTGGFAYQFMFHLRL